MVLHYQTARGTEVLGLAVPNIYDTAGWELGPTWCYLLLGPQTTLIDTGRTGSFEAFQALLESAGKRLSDIDRIIITHGHEDHDGNLAQILSTTPAELGAHPLYRQMISYHPEVGDGAHHPEMPGSCRLCPMSEEFYRNCLPYQQQRSSLNVDFAIDDNYMLPDSGLSFVSSPGHTPDSICVILENEVIFTGDTILPDITPHPSLAYAFEVNRRILPQSYRQKNTIYGLKNYIKSLNKIAGLASQPLPATFPAHRLFYNGRFNIIHSSSHRAREIIRFHIDRCGNILRLIDHQPARIEEIARQHFPPSLLTSAGKLMARNEVRAHLEIMEECGDICWAGENRDLAQGTGTTNFITILGEYLP